MTNPATISATNPGTTATPGPVAPVPVGLAERAVHAARAYHAADPDGFVRRHGPPNQWNRWARRARVARTVAAALQVPISAVLVTDDPHRTYRTRTGPVPGDLITVTDPATGRAWRFIPDHATPGDGWLLLDHCLDCEAEIPPSESPDWSTSASTSTTKKPSGSPTSPATSRSTNRDARSPYPPSATDTRTRTTNPRPRRHHGRRHRCSSNRAGSPASGSTDNPPTPPTPLPTPPTPSAPSPTTFTANLLAARDAGRIPAHVETTISASTITPLWGDDAPIALLLHIRFTGLADPKHAATRDEVITEAVASLDHRGAEHLPPDHVGKYGGALFFVDDHDRPQDTRMHTLRP